MNKKISIIMPTYNNGNAIEQAINSALNQKYSEVELLVIDDGSTDDTADVIKKIADRDQRIRYIYQENQGVSAARNKGIEAASGEYLMFIDSDDTYVDEAINRIVNLINLDEADWIIAGYYTVCNNKSTATKPDTRLIKGKRDIAKNIELFFPKSPFANQPVIFPAVWNKLYKKDIIHHNNILFEKGVNMGEDLRFNLSYLSCCESIYITDQIIYNYNISGQSISNSYKENEFSISVENIALLRAFYRNFSIDERRAAFQYIIAAYSCISHLHYKANKNKFRDNLRIIYNIIHTTELQWALKNAEKTIYGRN